MTNTIAQLSQAVAPAAALVLPEGLKAQVEVVVRADWHDLTGFVRNAYGFGSTLLAPLEGGNDTDYDCDASMQYSFQRTTDERERERLLASVKSGGIEVYSLTNLLCMAVQDGHLPAARYIVSLSW